MKKQVFTFMIAMMVALILGPVQEAHAADDTVVYVSTGGKKYHRSDCHWIENSTVMAVTVEDALNHGYGGCKTCDADGIPHSATESPVFVSFFDHGSSAVSTRSMPTTTYSSSTTQVPSVASTPTTPVAPAVSAAPNITSITPQQAVQQAFVLYVQNGIDQNTALQRVQAKTAEIVSNPANIAAIVAADINAIKAQAAATAPVLQVAPAPTVSALTPQQIVQQSFALYVQGGLDPNTALQRVQVKTAELIAAGSNFAAVVQADLAALKGAAPTATLTPEQIVQQAFAQFIAAGMTQDQALAAVQANLPALLAAAQ